MGSRRKRPAQDRCTYVGGIIALSAGSKRQGVAGRGRTLALGKGVQKHPLAIHRRCCHHRVTGWHWETGSRRERTERRGVPCWRRRERSRRGTEYHGGILLSPG